MMDCIVQLFIFILSLYCSRSRWPRGLERGSAAARLLGSRVRILSWAWQSVSCECCVLVLRAVCECVCVCVCVSLSVIRGNSNPLYTHTQVEDIRLRKKELLCTVSNLVIFTCDHDTSHFLTHVYVSMANYLHWNPATLGK